MISRNAALAVAVAAACLPTNANKLFAQTGDARAESAMRAPEQPAGDPRNYFTDPQLYTLLNHAVMNAAAQVALDDYENKTGKLFLAMVSEVAEDSSASLAARANALNLLAARKAIRYVSAVRSALHASDPRVRAVALATAAAFDAAKSKDAGNLLIEALDDPAPQLQAKALQFVGDADIGLLRTFAARQSLAPSVKSVVTGMIQAAEESGVALLPTDSSGALQRTSATGYTVRYTPTTLWHEWDASTGTVEVSGAGAKPMTVSGIEVVGNVIPVFFSADGKYAVYETGRRIHVREMSSGTDRDLGRGIAPRIRPITDQFIYMVEDTTARMDMRTRVKVRYEVRSAPFAQGTASTGSILGALGGYLVQGTHGNYSPVRWMRLEEHGGVYSLRGDGIEAFTLPSPFPGGAGS